MTVDFLKLGPLASQHHTSEYNCVKLGPKGAFMSCTMIAFVRINVLAQALPWSTYHTPYKCQTTTWRCEHIKRGAQNIPPGGRTNGPGNALSNGALFVSLGAATMTSCQLTPRRVYLWSTSANNSLRLFQRTSSFPKLGTIGLPQSSHSRTGKRQRRIL